MPFSVMPMFAPKGVEIRQVSIVGSILSFDGFTADGSASFVVLDARLTACRPLTKDLLERFHLEKVRLDNLARTGCLMFDGVERGSDPPDFRVNAGSTVVGLDVSTLALAERRLAYRLFDVFLEHVLAAKGSLPNLVDTQVLVWFNLGNGLPPKRSDRELAVSLVDCLRQLNLDRPRMEQLSARIASDGFPPTFPDWYPFRWLPGNEAGFQVSLLPKETAPSLQRQSLGFECRLHMSMFIDSPFVMREIQRLVKKHDKPGIDWLILTVGAPDPDGCVYPGEEVMYKLVEGDTGPVVADHIRRVLLHRWSTGEQREFRLLRQQEN
jgi:hypothetical protein